MTAIELKRLLHLSRRKRLPHHSILSGQVKAQLILARRRGDDERAAELSQAKEEIKRLARSRFGSCLDCGCVILAIHRRCALHFNRNKFYRNALKF